MEWDGIGWDRKYHCTLYSKEKHCFDYICIYVNWVPA